MRNITFVEDQKQGTLREVLAYWTFCAGLVFSVIAVLGVLEPNPLREHLARCWLLYVVGAAEPLHKMFRTGKALLVGVPALGFGLATLTWVAYDVYGYSPTAPVSLPWLGVALGVYVSAGLLVLQLTRLMFGVRIPFRSAEQPTGWVD